MFDIYFASQGQWQLLIGHGCHTLAEANSYVAALAPTGGMHVLQEGQELPACPQPPPPREINPETRKIILDALKDF